MENIHFSYIVVAAMVMIVLGCVIVSYDLYRIYGFWVIKRWKDAVGTVSGVSRIGTAYIAVTFTYSVFDGLAKKYKLVQNVPRDVWSESLSVGRLIAVKYNPANPNAALIQQGQLWSFVLFGVLNSLWIIIGILTLGIGQ